MKNTYQIIVLFITIFPMMCTSSHSKSTDREDVEFYSNDTKLSGSIIFPDERPIEAAVVFVQGSGRMQRNLKLAQRFASQGIATLVYDKRGVGRSEGTYVQADGSISDSDLNLLADDAAAAIELLQQHERIKGIPVGLTGISQAGWVIPISALKSQHVDYMGIWSGPVSKLSEEDIFSRYTSDRDFRNLPDFEEIEEMREFDYEWPTMRLGKDTDTRESLSLLDIPGFWIFGSNDGSIPVQLSITRLEELRDQGKEQYEYALFSGIGHGTIDQTFSTMTGWIKEVSATNPGAVKTTTILNQENLDKYPGVYTSMNPEIEVTITKQGTTLIAETDGEILEFEHLEGHTFLGHDVGNGFIFIDFNPESGRMTATEQGNKYTLNRR